MLMTSYHLLSLLKEIEFSPEKAAPYFGVSNMTLRRWTSSTKKIQIPEYARRSIIEGIDRLIAEGKISSEHKSVRQIMSRSASPSFEGLIKRLGATSWRKNTKDSYEDQATSILSEIGSDPQRRNSVLKNKTQIRSFAKLSDDWKQKVELLLDVVISKKLSVVVKSVAFGALFYMINPSDLVPDSVPVIGFMDDYGFATLATLFYTTKTPAALLINKSKRTKKS